MADHLVALTHDPRALYQHADFWYVLVESNPRATVFMTHEWMTAWWETFGGNYRLWLFQVYAADGRLIGLAPFVEQERSKGPLSWRRLSLLGTDLVDPDHVDLIAHPDYEQAVARAVLSALVERQVEWETLHLAAFWADSPFRAAIRSSGLIYYEQEVEACPYIPLLYDWGTFSREVIDPLLYDRLTQASQAIERGYAGRINYRAVSTTRDLLAAFDQMTTYSSDGSLAAAQAAHFHRRIAEWLLSQGWLHFHVLNVAGQDIAWLYGCLHKGRVYVFRIGADPNWNAYSPDALVMARSIQEAISKGAHEYDLLSQAHLPGGDWAAQVRHDFDIELPSPSPQGQRVRALRVSYHETIETARRLSRRLRGGG